MINFLYKLNALIKITSKLLYKVPVVYIFIYNVQNQKKAN